MICFCVSICVCVSIRVSFAYDMSVCAIYFSSQVGIPGGDITESEKVFLVAELLKMKCLPVFLEAPIARAAYHGYCKQVRTCYATLLLFIPLPSISFIPIFDPTNLTSS